MSGAFLTADGLTLVYDDQPGEGTPLLCLAGLTRSALDFEHFAAEMAGRRVIRLDARGRGRSDHSENWRSYDIVTEASDAVALMDHLGLDRAVIVGSSRGGYQAMVIAATARERIAGVVLNDVGPELSPKGLAKIMDYLGLPPKARTYVEAAETFRAEGDFDAPFEWFLDWARRTYRGEDGALELSYDARLRDAIIEQAAALDPDGPGLWPLFDALSGLPLLLLRAENSNLLSAEAAQRMADRRADMAVAVISGRGHIPRLDQPECLKAIKEFLNDHSL